MRPGPSTADLARGVAIAARVDSYRGGVLLAEDIPSAGVTVDWTNTRVVPTQVKLTAPLDWVPTAPDSPLANFGQRLHVHQRMRLGARDVLIEIGWYQIDSWDETDSGVEVTALDLMQIPEENPASWPSSPPQGATLRTELYRLSRIPVKLDNVADKTVPRSMEWGYSRTEAIRDLCDAYGLDYAIKPDGYLHAWAYRTTPPVAHYSARDLLLDAPRTSQPRRPNKWTVVGEGQEQNGWEDDEIVKSDFSSHSRSGWSAASAPVEWTYPDGASGDCARATWSKAKDASLEGPGLTFSKALAKTGTETITVKVRSSSGTSVRLAVWDGSTMIDSDSGSAKDSWVTLTVKVPDKKAAKKVTVSQSGTASDGHWIAIDSFKIVRTWTTSKTVKKKKTTTSHSDTLVDQTFNDHTRKGWDASTMEVAWQYPEDGRTGDHLRASWSKLNAGSTGRVKLRWAQKKDVPKDGKKEIWLWVKSKTSDKITVAAHGTDDGTIDAATVTATSWTKVYLVVPDQFALSYLTLSQEGRHGPEHWVGIDDFRILRHAPHMVDRRFTTTLTSDEYPLDVRGYGLVAERTELSGATTRQQVADAAGTRQRQRMITTQTRSLAIASDPRLEGGDLISVETDTGEHLVGQVVAYSLPLSDPDAQMRVDVEVHQW